MDPVSTSTPAIDPYAPPKANLAPDRGEEQRFLDEYGPIFRDASRITRLLAACADALISVIAAGGVVAGLIAWKTSVDPSYSFEPAHTQTSPFWGLIIAVQIGVLLIQSVFIATRGQSIGKILCRIRIVDVKTGQIPGFLRVVVLRAWLFSGIALLPWVGNLLAFTDVVIIFGEDRRCIHDHVAGTRVIDVQPGPRSEE